MRHYLTVNCSHTLTGTERNIHRSRIIIDIDTVIKYRNLVYFVLYLISYAEVRTKIKRTNIFQQRMFTRVLYMIWGAYETKTARNNNVQNISKQNKTTFTVVAAPYCVLKLMVAVPSDRLVIYGKQIVG